MQEEWKIVQIAPKYMISNLGRIQNRETRKFSKINTNRDYPTVGLDCNGVWLQKTIHKLVASAFVAGEAPGLIVNHIDGNKNNYVSDNLEWVTHKENMEHAVRTGLIRRMRTWTEEDWDIEREKRDLYNRF